MNDILLAIDKGLFSFYWIFLYWTLLPQHPDTAFQELLCIDGTALDWLVSYLKNREQRIVVNGVFSQPHPFPRGVPQGSIMGPLEFILYTGPLSKVISAHRDIQHEMYADDTQHYIILNPQKHHEAINSL